MPPVRRLGFLVLAGLLVVLIGACGDLAFHSAPVALAPLFGADGVRAHLVTLAGMLLAALGLVRRGLQPARSSARKGISRSHAHR